MLAVIGARERIPKIALVQVDGNGLAVWSRKKSTTTTAHIGREKSELAKMVWRDEMG